MRVDASFGSGHWYEGGGIYRDCFLVAANEVHVVENGLVAILVQSNSTDSTNGDSASDRGSSASSASANDDALQVKPSVEVTNEGSSSTTVIARFLIYTADSTADGTAGGTAPLASADSDPVRTF
jgi:hypothetical protein